MGVGADPPTVPWRGCVPLSIAREPPTFACGASVALGRVGVGVAALALLGPFLKGWRGGQVINISTALHVEKFWLGVLTGRGLSSARAAHEAPVGYGLEYRARPE